MDFKHYSSQAPDFSRKESIVAWLNGAFRNQFDKKGLIRPSRVQVLQVVKSSPELVQRFVQKNVDVRNSDDVVYLEQVKDEYHVYVTDRGKKIAIGQFVNLWEALDEYLKSWGLE